MPLQEEKWISKYWRPSVAYHYIMVCTFDFIVFPLLYVLLRAFLGIQLEPWIPLTLREGGLYHLAIGAILGVAAWTRGQEKKALIERGDQSPPQ